MCNACRLRLRKRGTVERKNAVEGAPRAFLIDAAASSTDDCIEWPYANDSKGYGRIWENGRTVLAHHVLLSLAGRPRPDGLEVLHSCDNPPCVNPRHLSWGTTKQNVHEAWDRGLKVAPRRSFTDDEIAVIRRRYDAGESQAAIAADYEVSQGTVSRALNGKAAYS